MRYKIPKIQAGMCREHVIPSESAPRHQPNWRLKSHDSLQDPKWMEQVQPPPWRLPFLQLYGFAPRNEWQTLWTQLLVSTMFSTGAVEQLPSCSTWNGHQLVTHWLLVSSSLRIPALGFAASLASTPSLCDLLSGWQGAKCPINYLTCYFRPYPQIIPVQSSTSIRQYAQIILNI